MKWCSRCKGSGYIDVVSDGFSFTTFSGAVLPKGRTVVCVCTCTIGQEINEKRDPKWLFPVYDAETMQREGEPPKETIAAKADDGWGQLPERNEAKYRQREPGDDDE